eukprot:14729008-Heterocapsa_arctica.AAC.1
MADSRVRPNNLVYITGYQVENQTKLGYLFYRDYGNDFYASYLSQITTAALGNNELTEEEAFYISRLCATNKGDILESVMGYAWIYNKKKYGCLKDFPEYVSILEKGLQSATEDSEEQEKEE